ncbi:filamentous hemagglutinin N-terminal domain-containing protein (plasmid) [Nostoc sp. UHCC 0302]|uniref:two-partner secretion domain-containing protein n=1 Tax=Nostoc sp. UHCC 0302 TaxID=3134896 RepID=UPI00311CB1CC
MKNKHYSSIKIVVISTFIHCLTIFSCKAQIIPDTTLPQNTTTNLKKNTIVIEGGSQSGNNLFHSFIEFSITKDNTVFFNNATNIQNIISRVTGSSTSNIDGLIRANGTANLFLINPNGIVFGQNARLDIGGSFVGSTASSINFSNGFRFSARNPQTKPLLTISVPSELQFEGSTARIEVKGTGHIFEDSDFRIPLDASEFANGLQVNPGKTLALIGGDILLDGGIISNRDGRIELRSINQGILNIEQENNKLFFNDEKNLLLNNIVFRNNSLVFVNSYQGKGNTINVQGRNIEILSGSSIFSQNHGNKIDGEIRFNVSNNLEIKDSTPLSLSSIFTSNFGNTPGENIQITANKINIEGSQIATTTFGEALGGNVILKANDLRSAGSIPSSVNPLGYGGINSFSYNSGSGGDITAKIRNVIIENNGTFTTSSVSYGQGGSLNLTSENIIIKNGGTLGSATYGKGNGGDVLVNTENLKLTGESILQSSSVTAITQGYGDAGNLAINTLNLFVQEGGSINTDTFAYGNAGDININAFNSIKVSGIGSTLKNLSSITSAADISSNEIIRIIYNLPPIPFGNAGSITLNTPNFNVANGAIVSVINNGLGNAGKVQINTNTTRVTNQGAIAAITAVGQGGDIGINSKAVYLQDSYISATAGTQGTNGDGGNINVNTDILTAMGNSSITANAYKGRGGNIQINAQGLFASRDSQFTASSQLGINGKVEFNISNENVVPAKAVPLTIQLDPEITSACQGRAGTAGTSEFVIIGTGSAPRYFVSETSKNSGWYGNPVRVSADNNLEQQSSPSKKVRPIVEAQSVLIEPSGDVNLLASPNQLAAVAEASPERFCLTTDSKPASASTLFP